jgi:hypothetical protein
MTLRRIEFGSDGFDCRMFECQTCDSTHTATIASGTRRSNPLDWLAVKLTPPA